MTVSEGTPRRRRYEASGQHRAITPKKVRLLQFIAENGYLTTFQIAGIAGITYKVAGNDLRDLFHAGLVAKIAVPRIGTEETDDLNDPSLIYGSAPDIYYASRTGLRYLFEADLIDRETARRPPPNYGPSNTYFLRHELQVRDVRVWISQLLRAYPDHSLTAWRMGSEAHLDPVRPDAWFVYQMPGAALLGFLEIDRGTEIERKWQEKGTAYQELLAHPEQVEAVTGKKRGRVLTIVPNEKRRIQLCSYLWEWCEHDAAWADRFIFATREVMKTPDLTRPLWQVPGRVELLPLVPPDKL